MSLTTKAWWQQRLDGSRKTGSQYDVTCSWSNEQRAQETGRIAAEVHKVMQGVDRLVDFGAGRGRLGTVVTQSWGIGYVGVEILPDLVAEMQAKGLKAFLYAGDPLPAEVDGDAALYCLIVQHLTDDEAVEVFKATKAGRIVLVEGVWKSDHYTLARTQEQYVKILSEAGCKHVGISVLETPMAKYKIVTGIRGNAS